MTLMELWVKIRIKMQIDTGLDILFRGWLFLFYARKTLLCTDTMPYLIFNGQDDNDFVSLTDFFRGIDNMKQFPMTLRGAEKLREELEFLKSVRRPEIIAAIAEAREHGDLKENAEYHAAREQQGFCEGRIQDIEAKLSNAQVIDVTKMSSNGRVIFGATVTVMNLDNEEEQTYRIVGDDEADFKQNLISVNSPIARGLIGKEEDDVVVINTPGGDVEYEIIRVEYL
ncbi:transcription elongation factor GreA|uniref:Transcription elongation factor GreA n=2 Tax=Brenneria salicis TaxID=55214 RepID=A0A366I1J7_9GAMM|nr:transcription elongation factor GreA [Brenneria salicis ATCC 15712 = DSM 30166]RBP59732.1 transcription elongation factor GreA [Brenneria salicis ATCC 15712 = DSM 30166]